MTAGMVTQTVVTPQLATAGSMLVGLANPQDASLRRALEKAEERLVSQPWRVADGVLQIVSFSRQNETHKTDGDFCECETKRGICWHRAAFFILSTLAAAGCYPVANLPLPAALDVDELPGDFLDSIDGLDFDDDGGITAPVRGVFYRGEYHTAEHLAAAEQARAVSTTDRAGRPRCITHEPEPGSDFARATELADRMFAA